MYVELYKHTNKITLLQFCVYVNVFLNNFNTTNRTFLVLGWVFYFKTKKIKKCDRLITIGEVGQIDNLLLKTTHSVFSNFWKKFQKLKRPKTEFGLGEYYINDFKTKLDKYNKIGFLVLADSFYLIRFKSKNLFKGLVVFNKPLLVTPKYSSSSINKYLSVESLQEFEFQFLRKNKVYNKGRYSRCRQNYRTGVYMCMYLSVVSIFGLYYWFYKFSFNFTYLWWLFIAFVASFFIPKIVKYRLYEPKVLFLKLFDFFRWVFLIIKSFF